MCIRYQHTVHTIQYVKLDGKEEENDWVVLVNVSLSWLEGVGVHPGQLGRPGTSHRRAAP